jgi:hypothetical protein
MKSPATLKSLTADRADQRHERRHSTTGDIWLRIPSASTGVQEMHCQLVDRSASGFRVEHKLAGLTSGQMMQFRIKGCARGLARTVWTRILWAASNRGSLLCSR